ncbi:MULTISPECIES: transcription-repair coupling factor [Bacteroides]|uniref:transcription-repair coupling factor n=1 Tax=Bacteroides TaxID=816 RepID=UPI001D5974EE|nr:MULTISPECIES: transcription-repair coupling factor [Bacteroides]HJD92737.1 transcription-repair coupling factor [Bacteroides coprosuis]
MTLSEIQREYSAHSQIKALSKGLEDIKSQVIHCSGLVASASPFLFSSLIAQKKNPYLFILNDLEDAGYFYHDLCQILGDKNVLFFPSSYRRAIKYGQKDAANEILRTEVLSRLSKSVDALCIVTYPDALAEKVVSESDLNDKTLKIAKGDRVELSQITERLRDLGFEYTDYVYEPGQFAIRGSLIDVFSYSSEYPYRIDFFGDEIDSIRSFEVESQLSKEILEKIAIVPTLGVVGAKNVSFLEFFSSDCVVAARDFFWIKERVEFVANEAISSQAIIAKEEEEDEKYIPPVLLDKGELSSVLKQFKLLEFGSATSSFDKVDATIPFDTTAQPIFHKNFDLVANSLKDYQSRGYAIYICSDSLKQTERIKAIFDDRGDDITFTAVEKTIHAGFVDNQLRACFFTDHQIFDRYHKYNLKSDKARSGKVALSLKEINEFKIGDYIVHTDHGIGRFEGLMRIPNGDTTQEVIKLVYQNEDVVFVSIHSLHKVSKYKGKEGQAPRLNKLGTGAWQKIKDKTKDKIKDIARDLIKLYAKRREEKGFAFSPDSFLQKELEASFIYEDTPDQSKSTQDVKQDMESNMPMDRLVCGDVGFGKTEIAIRAAFKAVTDNKQVAVLVPTTVLAYQHFQTFKERLKEFPCTVEYLTRARTTNHTKQVLKSLSEGKVDILIGTHKILGKNVKFKDLGLLIIDEEQKFGVSVKEKLRQMKVNVDTLTLTATPIPRTLQFSLMGARDLSIISTPPPNRYPIQTEVHTFNEEIITDAINFEMSRNGQVFFVNNRIANLIDLKLMIQKNIPDCRVCIGHGQMDPKEMEETILAFANYDYDVLLSTTIIESGIDIPNANTIIINQAQNFGLSDLHQMRGRVGRSNKKAFCYLLAPPLSSLTDEARRRLQAIENFSDLGSGIHIAMQDLDIRGAGNLLGAEQSGFIADLGYETYQKILSEAVHELKQDEFSELYLEDKTEDGTISGEQFVLESQLESDLELLLPNNYVTGSSERMLLYRELDNLKLDEEVEAFKKRLIDRFGPIPSETEELLRVVPLRRIAARLGVERIFLKAGRMTLFFVTDSASPYFQSEMFGRMINYMMRYTRRCDLREKNGKRSMLVKEVTSVEEAVSILQEIIATPSN